MMKWLGRLVRGTFQFAVLSAVLTVVIVVLDAVLAPERPAGRE